jgi:hypothetical protein
VSNFKVGDRVRIIKAGDAHPQRLGVVATVTGVYENTRCPTCECGPLAPIAYTLDLPNLNAGHEGCSAAYQPFRLELIYDGHEKTTWSECAWQPNKVRA